MPIKNNHHIKEVNEPREPAGRLIEYRIPWLFLGLIGGVIASFIVSRYEHILTSDIRLAFFIPIIVYMSDAVGTQTETIFIRTISKERVKFTRYIIKEAVIGLGLGGLFGVLLGIFAGYWLKSAAIGITVGLAMFVNLMLAPVIAALTSRLLYAEHFDPALGAGPVTTVIQDLVSLLVYFFVATAIIF